MRRIIMVGTAAVVLIGAVAAYAATSDFNSYKASLTFSPTKAGTKAKPSAFSSHQVYTAQGNNGQQAGPLTRIVIKTYGVRSNGKDFPKCTAAMINNAGSSNGSWNKVCPAGSLIAQGPVNSEFVAATTPSGPGTPCNPYLFVYNGGENTQVFFFTEAPFAPGPQYTCAGGAVKTGAAAAYNGNISYKGGSQILTIPLPTNVSTSAGGLTGVYASLVKVDIRYKKLTRKVKGKTVAYADSIACKSGKRPYSYTFTAQNYLGQSPSTQTTTISHSSKC